jgi:hypothetical protein
MSEHVSPEIGDDAFADGHHQIEPRRAGAGEHRHHRDHHAEVAVDQGDAFGSEPKVDHAPDCDRHHQGRYRRDRQRDQRQGRAPPVARHIGRELQQRTQPRAAFGRLLRQHGLDGWHVRWGRIVPRRRVAMPAFNLFRSTHEI